MDIIKLETRIRHTFFKMLNIGSNILPLIMENKCDKIIRGLYAVLPKIAGFINKNAKFTHYALFSSYKKWREILPACGGPKSLRPSQNRN